jgi:hypothetical protein
VVSDVHSPVGPSQHPTFKRQRGHCQVACRHSMAAPHRKQVSNALVG